MCVCVMEGRMVGGREGGKEGGRGGEGGGGELFDIPISLHSGIHLQNFSNAFFRFGPIRLVFSFFFCLAFSLLWTLKR